MANVIKIKRGAEVPTTSAQLAPGEIGFNTTDDSLYMNKGTDTTPDIVRVGEDANSILTKIKTVDGASSGLDADLLDGKHASAFSLDGHNQSWTTITDTPTTATRWPRWSEVTSKPSTFTPSSHTHSYLPLSGGTLTGNLDVGGDMYVSGDIFNESVPVTQIKNVNVPASVEAYGVHSSTVRIYHYLGYVPKFVVITKATKMGAGIQASLFALNSSYLEVNFSRYSSFGAHAQTLALQFYGTGGTVIV